MAKDPRNSSYKRLKSKVLSSRKRSYDFDDVLSRVTQSLLPKQQRRSGPSSQGNTNAMQEDFNKRLALMDSKNAKNLRAIKEGNEASTKELREQAALESKRNSGISRELHAAIQKLYASKQQGSQSQPTSQPIEEGTSTSENSLSYTAPKVKSFEDVEKPPTTGLIKEGETFSVVPEVIKEALEIGQKVNVGDYTYRVTNLFGPRTGKNAVKGRGPGHSRGVDVVTHGANGEITNEPIAVADGIIKSISLHGDGSNTGTEESTTGGYTMNVLMDDGKIMRYMHLSPDIEKQYSKLIGTRVKRGQVLFEGDHSLWSGSGTANHSKLILDSSDSEGNIIGDYNDPTPYILYGKQN
jgi:hypothetical protein